MSKIPYTPDEKLDIHPRFFRRDYDTLGPLTQERSQRNLGELVRSTSGTYTHVTPDLTEEPAISPNSSFIVSNYSKKFLKRSYKHVFTRDSSYVINVTAKDIEVTNLDPTNDLSSAAERDLLKKTLSTALYSQDEQVREIFDNLDPVQKSILNKQAKRFLYQ